MARTQSKFTARGKDAFRLQVIEPPRGRSPYGLALYQEQPFRGSGAQDEEADTLIERVWGDPLLAVMEQVLQIIREAGYRPSDLRPGRKAPFLLTEELGVRLGLLFLAVKPLRKHRKIERIAQHLQGFPVEEAYYWYAHSTGNGRSRAGRKALRILIGE